MSAETKGFWIWSDRLANIATVLLACALIVYVALWHFRGSHSSGAVRAEAVYEVGEVVPALPGLDYTESARTFVAIVRSDCHYCSESLPFFTRVVAERDKRSAPIRVVLAAPESDPSPWRDVSSADLRPDAKMLFPRGALKVRVTPTLLLLDSSGQVLRVWEGQLSPAAEAHVLNEIFGQGAA